MKVARNRIETIVNKPVSKQYSCWYAIKLFERDEKVMEQLSLSSETVEDIEQIIADCEEIMDDDSENVITNERYLYIGKVIKKCLHKKSVGMTSSDKIDRIVTNRWLTNPIFASIMVIVYFVSVSWLGMIVTDWTNDTFFGSWIQPAMGAFLSTVGAAEWLQGLVIDGNIGGVGAVLRFVPQMMILFFFLSILEDCGYMAHVALPMLISSGWGVAGIMASRTIEQDKSWWVAPSTYLLGILMVIVLEMIKMLRG